VFLAALGVTEKAMPDDWMHREPWTMHLDRIYLAKTSNQVCNGDHVFALGAGRHGQVMMLCVVTDSGSGAKPVPHPEDPKRWPYSFAIEPLACVGSRAESVTGATTPRGTANRVRDADIIERLYANVESRGEAPPSRVDAS
jgi:hypothetical protein